MIIEQILKTKGHDVKTVRAADTLQVVARVLDDARIGAVVALDASGEIVGVLSERDIIRQMARNGARALDMACADAMTRDVITATATESIQVCLARMTDRRIRHLPIVNESKLVGIISIGDLVKWKIAETEAEAESLKSYLTS